MEGLTADAARGPDPVTFPAVTSRTPGRFSVDGPAALRTMPGRPTSIPSKAVTMATVCARCLGDGVIEVETTIEDIDGGVAGDTRTPPYDDPCTCLTRPDLVRWVDADTGEPVEG